jgi:hypothetical protein
VIDRLQPDVVVTIDASDAHRDHAQIRDATLAAVERSGPRGRECTPEAGQRRRATDVEDHVVASLPVGEVLAGVVDDGPHLAEVLGQSGGSDRSHVPNVPSGSTTGWVRRRAPP